MRFSFHSQKEARRGDLGEPIRLGELASPIGGEEEAAGRPWGLFLVIFMRLLAALWLFQGLEQWVSMLLPSESLFDRVTQFWGAAVIFFALLDLVAAVGLWLATPWGGVIWLFSAMAQIFAAAAIPGFFATGWIAVNILLIAIYFGLSWRAGHPTPLFVRPRRR